MTVVRRVAVSIAASALALVIACSKQSTSPSAPSSAAAAQSGANADGSTLKVTAPTLQSPINGVKLPPGPVTLVAANSTTRFATQSIALSYRFEVTPLTGAAVESTVVPGGSGTTSRTVAAPLNGDQTYQWRARAEYQGSVGPWSGYQTFVAPPNEGYIRGNELYDPLDNGKTIGSIDGPGGVTFVPGVGVKLNTKRSWISYRLPATLTDGEFSILFTNVTPIAEETLRRLISMRQGEAAINDNPYRMSVGVDSNGEIDWRLIPGGEPYIKTEGDAQRPKYAFKANLTYFLQATWHNNFFHVVFKEGGVNGTTVYDFGKQYVGTYAPNPHNVYIGSPYAPGDRGEPVSEADAIIRQIWVSPNPRPAFANR